MTLLNAQDFHPDAAWRAAAAAAAAVAAGALAEMHGRSDLRQLLLQCEQRLRSAVAAAQQEGPGEDRGRHSEEAEEQSWVPWLRVCRTLQSAWDRCVLVGMLAQGDCSSRLLKRHGSLVHAPFRCLTIGL